MQNAPRQTARTKSHESFKPPKRILERIVCVCVMHSDLCKANRQFND